MTAAIVIAIAAVAMSVTQYVLADSGESAGPSGVPSVISYQGLLTDPGTGQPVPNGTYNMSFSIFNAPAGGVLLWQEPAAGAIPVSVANGTFTHLLGSDVPLAPGDFFGGTAYLQVFVNGETLTPRQRITAVAFAMVAEEAANANAVEGLDLAGLDTRFVNEAAERDFPRPDYDSGYVAIAQGGAEVLEHNLGGDPDDYFVDMWCNDAVDGFFGPLGSNNMSFALDQTDGGAGWAALQDDVILLIRGSSDQLCEEIRIRIWVIS
ncbi:MAG: hypothetical protein WD939_00145 [Dehalococcoidia bacterium]